MVKRSFESVWITSTSRNITPETPTLERYRKKIQATKSSRMVNIIILTEQRKSELLFFVRNNWHWNLFNYRCKSILITKTNWIKILRTIIVNCKMHVVFSILDMGRGGGLGGIGYAFSIRHLGLFSLIVFFESFFYSL